MVESEYDIVLEIDPGETPAIYSRVVNHAGTAYTQASLSTVAQKLIKLSDETTVSSGDLTIASAVFDTLQSWPTDLAPDSLGYNFLHKPSAANLTGENEQYEQRYTFTDAAGVVSLLRALIKTRSLPG